MMKKERVEKFIFERFPEEDKWLTGNCYYFAAILCKRFPGLVIYYLPIRGHFVAGDGKDYYDWTGKVDVNGDDPVIFSHLRQDDKPLYERLRRDCIL